VLSPLSDLSYEKLCNEYLYGERSRDGSLILAVGKLVATGFKRGKIFSDVHICDKDGSRNDV
jgi:hypothetical protein